jgi:hypothetical protein
LKVLSIFGDLWQFAFKKAEFGKLLIGEVETLGNEIIPTTNLLKHTMRRSSFAIFLEKL